MIILSKQSKESGGEKNHFRPCRRKVFIMAHRKFTEMFRKLAVFLESKGRLFANLKFFPISISNSGLKLGR